VSALEDTLLLGSDFDKSRLASLFEFDDRVLIFAWRRVTIILERVWLTGEGFRRGNWWCHDVILHLFFMVVPPGRLLESPQTLLQTYSLADKRRLRSSGILSLQGFDRLGEDGAVGFEHRGFGYFGNWRFFVPDGLESTWWYLVIALFDAFITQCKWFANQHRYLHLSGFRIINCIWV